MGNLIVKQPRLTLLGAGPGDPELLTIKGLKALQAADVVLYDALVDPALLAYAPLATAIFVGKRRGCRSFDQAYINRLAVAYAHSHGHVVRLKGGDPFVFGRGYEELDYARAHGVAVDYIPGLSSAIAVPGLAGIPVTHRHVSRSFWVVTATTAEGEISPDLTLAAASDATVVVLMGLAKLPEITAIFSAAGKTDLPVAVLQNGSRPTAKTVVGTVRDIQEKVAAQRIESPALIVLGEVAGLAGEDCCRSLVPTAEAVG